MLPPRLVRRLVLVPLEIVVAVAVAVLLPLLALLAAAFRRVGLVRPGRRRGLRLLYFMLVWLVAGWWPTPRRFSCAWPCG